MSQACLLVSGPSLWLSVNSSIPFFNIKKMLLPWLKENDYWLEDHIFGSNHSKTVQTGFLLQKSTTHYSCTTLQSALNMEIEQLYQSLKSDEQQQLYIPTAHNTDTPKIRLRLTQQLHHCHDHSPHPITIKCFAAECTTACQTFIDYALTSLSESNVSLFGLYMPSIITCSAIYLSTFQNMAQKHLHNTTPNNNKHNKQQPQITTDNAWYLEPHIAMWNLPIAFLHLMRLAPPLLLK